MFFASAAFLAGLMLLTVPWWLHRLNAHAAEQRTFSSLFLMRASEAPVNMRKQLQHLLLLALRWLLLIAACLAFAEPIIELAGSPTQSEGPDPQQIFVIDTSLSMAARVDGESPFDSALDETRELISDLRPGVKAAIVSAADQLELVVPLTDDKARLSGALASLETGAARLNVGGLMSRITTLADTLVEPGERLEIVFISDFQASGLPDQFNALIEGAVWPTILRSVTDPESIAANRAISSMRPGQESTLNVSVRSFNAPPENVEVVLTQNDSPVGSQTIFVPENSSVSATFSLPDASDRGRRAVTWIARLETGDSLAADNVRRLVMTDAMTTELPVLAESDRAWAYLRAAVEAAAPRFVPERVTELNNPTAPVVIVLGTSALSGGLDRVLSRYLETGGAVLMTVGPETRAAGRIPLIDLPLTADRFSQEPRGAMAVDRSHPALAGFASWQDLTFFQVVSTVNDGRTAGEVILTLDDGTPLLTEYQVGAGQLMLLGTAFDPAWSTLVVRPAFISFMANLLGYLAEDMLPAEALVGQPFAIPAQNVQLFNAAGERVLGLAETVGRPTVSLREPGLYQLRTPSSSRMLAVNSDLAESDLTPAGAEQLRIWQSSANRTVDYLQAQRQNTAQSEPPEPAPQAATQRELPLAPWLLTLLALVVFVEPLFANLGSNRTRTGAEARV